MTKRVVCKHGIEIGVTIAPAEFYAEGMERPADQVIQRITSTACDLCFLEAVGLGVLGEKQDGEKK